MKRSMQTSTSGSLLEGPIWRQLLLYALPIFFSNLLQQAYNAADAVIVGNTLGSLPLAAVSSVGSIVNMLVGLFLGLATGASVVISQHFGAGRVDKMHASIHTAMAVGLAGGILLTVAGVALAPQILRLMNTPDEVMEYSVTYLRIYFCGSLATMVYNMGTGILRACGDSKRPLYYLAISCVVNVGLDLLMIVVFQMGIAGAAVATVLSQVIAAVLVMRNLLTSGQTYRVILREIRFHKRELLDIISLGLPGGFQSVVISLSNAIIQAQINGFGPQAMAGCGAYFKVDGFVATPIFAFGLAIATFVGQNMGASQEKRAKRSTIVCLRMTIGLTVVIGGAVVLFGRPILSLFTSDPEVIEYGLMAAHIMAPTYTLLAVVNVFGNAVRGAGSAMPPTVIQAVCMCLLRVAWILGLTMIWNDLRVVLYSYPFSWGLAALCMVLYYWKGGWLKKYYARAARRAAEEQAGA